MAHQKSKRSGKVPPSEACSLSSSPQDPVSSDAAKKQWLKEQLLAPSLLQAVQFSKAGFTDDLQDLFPSEDSVLNWLKKGADLDELALLLTEYPSLHKDPLISEQLDHLHNLATGFVPLSDFGAGVMDFKQQEAQVHLQRILQSWGEGMLPGFTVSIIPQTSTGRHRVYNRHEVLAHYKELLQGVWWRLKQQPKKEDDNWFRRRKDESVQSFADRIEKLSQDLYRHSSLSTEIYLDPQKPFLKETGKPNTIHSKNSLTLEQKTLLARLSIRQSNKSISITNLLYGLLALKFTGEITIRSIKEIEKVMNRAEGDYPARHKNLQFYLQKIKEALP